MPPLTDLYLVDGKINKQLRRCLYDTYLYLIDTGLFMSPRVQTYKPKEAATECVLVFQGYVYS